MTVELRRSALFVPVGVERFYRKAASSGADLPARAWSSAGAATVAPTGDTCPAVTRVLGR